MKHFDRYAKLIRDGHIPANEYIKLTIKRVERLKKSYTFKQEEADKRISFIENECSNTKGLLGPLKLALPQKARLEVAWGFYHDVTINRTDPETMRSYATAEERRLINEIPVQDSRGAGKTTLCAAIGNVGQIADGEYGADVQMLATTRDQAGYLFNANRAMMNYEPSLLFELRKKDLLSSTKQGILYRPTNSTLSIKTSDYDTLDGTNAHYNIFDEVHAYDEDFINVVNTGSKRKRKNWMSWYITSGGIKRDKVFDRYIKKWIDVLRGVIDDDSIMPWLYRVDDTAEIHKPNLWAKAIPMLGITVERESVARDIELAKDDPADQAELLAKTFGVPINNYLAYFTNKECKGNYEAFRDDLFWGTVRTSKREDGTLEEIVDRASRVVIGVDLSDVNDICSVSFMIPSGEDRYFLNQKYMPRVTLDKLPKAQADKYLEWEAKGQLKVHEHDYNDSAFIFGEIKNLIKERHMLPVAVGYDPWASHEIKRLFEDHYGNICYPINQTVKVLSNPLKVYKAKATAGRIVFDDPVATWCHMNVHVKIDANKNIFPNKQKAKDKIDVFASMLDAFVCYENMRDELVYYFE